MDKELERELAVFVIEATNHINELHKSVISLSTISVEHSMTLKAMLLRIRALENENAKMRKEFEQLSLLN